MFNVRVLRSWDEIGSAINELDGEEHRFHRNPAKNWDLVLIRELALDLDRDSLVVDLGCSTLGPVRLVHEMGFRRIWGCDLSISRFDRVIQLRDWLSGFPRIRPPYRLATKNLTATGLADSSASLVVCLSVIEHAVDIDGFFSEVARTLKPKGRLYLSTDYWEPRLDTNGRKMYGLNWKVFCKSEVLELIDTARRFGLHTSPPTEDDLKCADRVIRDGPDAYTFVALRFEKR